MKTLNPREIKKCGEKYKTHGFETMQLRLGLEPLDF